MTRVHILLFDVMAELAFPALLCVKQNTAYEMRISDWSSDVCSSDLIGVRAVDDVGLRATPGNDEWPEVVLVLEHRRRPLRFVPAADARTGDEQLAFVDEKRATVERQPEVRDRIVDMQCRARPHVNRQARDAHPFRNFCQVLVRHLPGERKNTRLNSSH